MATIKQKTVISGSARNWEGDTEIWKQLGGVIEPWCDGEMIEYKPSEHSEWQLFLKGESAFHTGTQYRIKQREPKPGEVWFIADTLYLIHALDGDHQSLNGKSYCNNGNANLKYAAPSVEACYMRIALERYEVVPIDSLAGQSYNDWLVTAAHLEE